MTSSFIASGTPCDICHIGLMTRTDKPTVVETHDGQVTAHWACLPPDVQRQVLENEKRGKAELN